MVDGRPSSLLKRTRTKYNKLTFNSLTKHFSGLLREPGKSHTGACNARLRENRVYVILPFQKELKQGPSLFKSSGWGFIFPRPHPTSKDIT